MSRRRETILIGLVALTLAALSVVAAWVVTDGERLGWTALATVLLWVCLGIAALAWAGWGRWLLGQAGTRGPSRRWWYLWFVPWVLWAARFLAGDVIDEFDEVIHGSPDGLALLPLVPAVVVGVVAALGAFILILAFAFREFDHLVRRRKSGSAVSG